MLDTDPPAPRPALMSAALIAHTLDDLRPTGASTAEMWRLLTDRYVVDLDAVAGLLPHAEPETVWLQARD